MLNRIYIVVGIFAIVVLGSAFILPRFIHWADYRDRMEVLASQVLGTDVSIRGDIAFSLLPTPRLEFDDVVVGPATDPAATVRRVEAEFALMDFLRDIYNATSVSLIGPVVDFTIDENGLLASGVDMSNAGTGVALGHASITDGSVRLNDVRSHETFTVSNLSGDLRLSSLGGPFQFQGNADYADGRYELRLNSGASDAQGAARVSAFVRDLVTNTVFNADGSFESGLAPKFDGTLTYRQPPQLATAAKDITGDLVLETKITASTDRVSLTGFTLSPDQNRSGMRLTGTANVQLGETRFFDIMVSGGVFSLPPRDASEVAAEQAYEFVRLLGEIPAPPIPKMAGKLEIDLAEVGMRGFSLRNLRVEATTDGDSWTIAQAIGLLPGQTETRFSGKVTNAGGSLGVMGDIVMRAQRLDALAALWRKPSDDNPLFGVPGELHGRVRLGSDAFGLSNAWIALGGQDHGLDLRIGFGAEPRLDTVLRLGDLDAPLSEALFALAPNASLDSNFLISFPDGSFSVQAQALDVLGVPAQNLVGEAQWSRDAIRFSRLSVDDWGGVGFNGTVRLSGSLLDPNVTLSGGLNLKEAGAPGLTALYEMANVPFDWQQAIDLAMPADLQIVLADAEQGSGQTITANGSIAEAALDVRVESERPISHMGEGQLSVVASIEAQDSLALLEQFGWTGPSLFTGDEAMVGSAFVDGTLADGFTGRLSLGQDGQVVAFYGDFDFDDGAVLSGTGTADVILRDGSGLAAWVGVSGAQLPPVEASASMEFVAGRSLALSEITGASGDTRFSGDVSMQMIGQLPGFGGTITTDRVDTTALAAFLFGGEALIGAAEGVWPEGPLATAHAPRQTRGNVEVIARELSLDGRTIGGDTSFMFLWDQQSATLGRFETALGGGKLSLNLVNCCAGALSERTISGRGTMTGVTIAAVAPELGLSGILDGSGQFEGAGQSLAEVVRSLSGEGNFAIQEFGVAGHSTAVYPALVNVDDVLNTPPEVLETVMRAALEEGKFGAPVAPGAFTIAGGTVRVGNMFIDGEAATLSGSLQLALNDMGVSGSFVMMPKAFEDPRGLVELDNARILTRLGGTVSAPEATLDLSEISAAVQVRANEIELDRLDALRLEDEARQRAAAEDRNRRIEEQRRLAAEEAARIAAEEEAARLAAGEEAARAAEPVPPFSQPLVAPEPILPNFDQQTIEMLIQSAPDASQSPTLFAPTIRPLP
ncbi:AsmA family protein [Devosia sp. MC1541]|uniref:AsmA family protein n=1 Tax=Devosia sp. MC1541 TaxID=2725264 RepID=UPI00145FC298|nr:AsmA family protein [Devosia sp. MC1541]